MNGERGLPRPRRRVGLTIVAWLVGIAVAGIGLALGADMSPGSPYRLGSIAVVAVGVVVVTAVRRRRHS